MKFKKIAAMMVCMILVFSVANFSYATETGGTSAKETEESDEEKELTQENKTDTKESENTEESSDDNKEEKEEEKEDSKESEEDQKAKQDAVNQANQAVNSAKKEQESMQAGLNNAKKILKDLENSKGNLESYVTSLDNKLNEIASDLTALAQEIENKEEEIEKTQKQLEEDKKAEEKQYQDMKKRIKYMYEKGNDSFLTMLLEAESMSELLNKADYISKISAYDRDMLEKFKATKERTIATEKQLQEEYDELQVKKNEALEKQTSTEELIKAKNQELDTFEGKIKNQEQLIKEYDDDIKEQNRVIAALEAAAKQAAEAAAASGGTKKTYDGGVFAFPCPGYTRVSSPFGNRMHPTLGVVKFHNGIDLAAPAGTPILAAYNGTVVGAAYNASMGNYVMIDHGDNLYTIYMHASALYVSTGQEVSKGQTIAAVGSTGRSTGNHLHFGVRLNGNYVSPNSYIGM